MIDVVTIRPGAEVIIARALPASTRMLLSWDSRAIRTFDAATHESSDEIPFPDGCDLFVIDQWYVHPSGSWSLAMGYEQDEFALAFDHAAGTARRIERPNTMGLPTGYAWFDEQSLEVVTEDGLVWRLDGDAWSLVAPCEGSTAWQAKLDVEVKDLKLYSFLKPDFGQGVTYLWTSDLDTIGVATMPGAEAMLVGDLDVPSIVDVAGFGPSLLLATAAAVHRHRPGHKPRLVYETGPDEEVMQLQSLRHGGVEYLVIVCETWGEPGSRLHIIDASAGG